MINCVNFVIILFYLNFVYFSQETKIIDITNSSRWKFKFDDDPNFIDVSLPNCWENIQNKKKPLFSRTRTRLGIFKTNFSVHLQENSSYFLLFEAVSYSSKIYFNNNPIFSHIGSWDDFYVDITEFIKKNNEMEIHVEKPACNVKGPNSKFYPGNYHVTETLSGFLPYVYGYSFGGIYQPIFLYETPKSYIIRNNFFIIGYHNGSFESSFSLSSPTTVDFRIFNKNEKIVFEKQFKIDKEILIKNKIEDPIEWDLVNPYLYTLEISTIDGDVFQKKFGFRTVNINGNKILLNEKPIYPRFALSWGYFPSNNSDNFFVPYPRKELIREIFLNLRKTGINGMKICLWVGPKYYYEIADEVGFLIWQELPIWMPEKTDFFYQQTLVEFPRIVKKIRNHASVIIYTVGCEIQDLPMSFLNQLYSIVKSYTKSNLVAINSGGFEAYGLKTINDNSDFYDNHFYADIFSLRGLYNNFRPIWRHTKPWLEGETCDKDTFRNIPKLFSRIRRPFWMKNDSFINPQGSRWDYDVVNHEEKVKKLNLWNISGDLERKSIEQSFYYRKQSLEYVRSLEGVSGYTITGLVDTPISTSGFFDDTFSLKYANEFKKFNDKTVMMIGFDRERVWKCGGDRIAFYSKYNYFDTQNIRIHLILSHFGRKNGYVDYNYVLKTNEKVLKYGKNRTKFIFKVGNTKEFGIVEFYPPKLEFVTKITLEVNSSIENEKYNNNWSLFLYPSEIWTDIRPFSVIDKLDIIQNDFFSIVPQLINKKYTQNRTAVVTLFDKEAENFVLNGGKVILLQRTRDNDIFKVKEVPFYRESMHLIEDHISYGDFPWREFDNNFYPIATDIAFDIPSSLECTRIHKRLDCRKIEFLYYVADCRYGKGNLFISTLRVEGKLGDLPYGLKKNVVGVYLLNNWLRYLQSGK